MLIAIDGPSGSGKGELSKRIAAFYKIHHLDTGRFFRKLAVWVQDNNVSLDDEEKILSFAKTIQDFSFRPAYQSELIANLASKLAELASVRLVFKERVHFYFCHFMNGAGVLDGRDVGTVLFPNADIKIYLTADSIVRTIRRQQEYNTLELSSINAMKERDKRDQLRKSSPLMCAKDAYVVDTTHLSLDEVFEKACAIIESSKPL